MTSVCKRGRTPLNTSSICCSELSRNGNQSLAPRGKTNKNGDFRGAAVTHRCSFKSVWTIKSGE